MTSILRYVATNWTEEEYQAWLTQPIVQDVHDWMRPQTVTPSPYIERTPQRAQQAFDARMRIVANKIRDTSAGAETSADACN